MLGRQPTTLPLFRKKKNDHLEERRGNNGRENKEKKKRELKKEKHIHKRQTTKKRGWTWRQKIIRRSGEETDYFLASAFFEDFLTFLWVGPSSTFATRVAKVRDCKVSSASNRAGLVLINMRVLACPPRES